MFWGIAMHWSIIKYKYEDTEVKFINMGKISNYTNVLPFVNHDTAMKNSYMPKNLHTHF